MATKKKAATGSRKRIKDPIIKEICARFRFASSDFKEMDVYMYEVKLYATAIGKTVEEVLRALRGAGARV